MMTSRRSGFESDPKWTCSTMSDVCWIALSSLAVTEAKESSALQPAKMFPIFVAAVL